jgi:hypothetical protein
VRSTVLTSQLPVSRIGDLTLADGILDRLVHNAHRIEMRGASMWKNHRSGIGKRYATSQECSSRKSRVVTIPGRCLDANRGH